MTGPELQEALKLIGTTALKVEIGVDFEYAHTIRETPSGRWEVYYVERGQHHDRKLFASEHAACLYLFDMVGGVDESVRQLRDSSDRDDGVTV